MCSYVLVKETNVIDVYEINHIKRWKWNQVKNDHLIGYKIKNDPGAQLLEDRLASGNPGIIFYLSFFSFVQKYFRR